MKTQKNTPRIFFQKTLALAFLFVLTGGVHSLVAVSAPVSAIFLCPRGHAVPTTFGSECGNTKAAPAVNTDAGSLTPGTTPDLRRGELFKTLVDMKNTTRRAPARPEAVRQAEPAAREEADAAGVDLNEVLVTSPSPELEVRIWTTGDVQFIAGREADGFARVDARIPQETAAALGAWLVANLGKRGVV